MHLTQYRNHFTVFWVKTFYNSTNLHLKRCQCQNNETFMIIQIGTWNLQVKTIAQCANFQSRECKVLQKQFTIIFKCRNLNMPRIVPRKAKSVNFMTTTCLNPALFHYCAFHLFIYTLVTLTQHWRLAMHTKDDLTNHKYKLFDHYSVICWFFSPVLSKRCSWP
jgi:hypothetical protein